MNLSSVIIGRSKSTEELKRHLLKLASSREHIVLVGEAGTGKSSIAAALASTDSTSETVDLTLLNEADVNLRMGKVISGSIIIEGLDSASFSIQSVVSTAMTQSAAGVRFIITLREKVTELAGKRRLVDEIYAKLLEFESVEILPLRRRQEDIPDLVRQFASDLIIDINSLDMLMKRSWRENIRELRVVIERSLASAKDGVFMLPPEYLEERTEVAQVVNSMLSGSGQRLDESLDAIEKNLLEKALHRFGFNIGKVASFLGMSEPALEHKLHRLALVGSQDKSR